MKNPALRALLTILFLGLLAAPVLISRLTAQTSATAGEFGFRFTEASKAAGIEFVHEAPSLDPKLAHIMPEIAAMGAAASVVDFDRDGWSDLYVTNSREDSLNRLYRNREDGTFEEVGERLGVADVNRRETGVSMGALWGDYDNDGFEDLYLNKWGRPELFHNDAGKSFTRVTERAGLPAWLNANSAVWFDYDRDGLLDLFIGGYYRDDINLWRLDSTRIMPESFEYAQNGGRKILLRNRGDGTFQDVTEQTGLKSTRWALAAAAADLRGTGYPDLVIANDYGVTELFANEGGKRFREIGKLTGVAEQPKSGMNVSFGDVNNEGRLAIYISNLSQDGYLIQGNNLWMPVGDGDRLKYINQAVELGVHHGDWSFGTQFGDLNNDGWIDLFLTNGFVSADPNGSYWYDFSKVTGGNTEIISDAMNWPPIGNRSHSGHQKKRVWMNQGGKRFIDVAPLVGVTETFDGRAVAMADFSNRGALDVVVAHQKGPVLLYRNQVDPQNGWIQFELEGRKSNRGAVGTSIRLFWDGKQQLQELSAASGFCAQNHRRVHFGLGPRPAIEKAVVRWPSGKEQTIDAPEPGKLHRIKEPA